MQKSAEAVIITNDLKDEISRLRLIIGSLREELWTQVWSGLYMDQQRYEDETNRLIYGEQL